MRQTVAASETLVLLKKERSMIACFFHNENTKLVLVKQNNYEKNQSIFLLVAVLFYLLRNHSS